MTGTLFFLFLLVLSIIYFKERCFNFDNSFYLWKLIVLKQFSIEHFRTGAFITQLLPSFLIKNKFGLSNIALSYSASFVLLQLLIYLIIVFVLKDIYSALIFILTWVLLIRGSFYNPCTEAQQGMAFVLLQLSVLQKSFEFESKKKYTLVILSGLLSYVILNFHVILILPAFFIHGYLLLENRFKHAKEIFISFTFLCIAIFFKRVIGPVSDYEIQKQIPMGKRFELLPDTFDLPSTKYFMDFISDHWMFILPVIVLLVAFQLRSKNIFLSIYYWFALLLIFILIFQSQYSGDSPMMYENNYIVMGFLIAFGLIKSGAVYFEKKSAIIIFCIYIILSSYSIVEARTNYCLRLQYLERLIEKGQQMPEKKYILTEANYPGHYAWGSWALPFETSLLSSLNGADNTVTIFCTDNLKEAHEYSVKPNTLLCPYWTISRFKIPAINNYLFRFPLGSYHLLNDSIHDIEKYNDLKNKITIIASRDNKSWYGHNLVFNISINNSGFDTIYSGMSGKNNFKIKIELSSRDHYFEKQISFPLEKDFVKEINQTILIGLSKEEYDQYDSDSKAKVSLMLNEEVIAEAMPLSL